MGKYATVVIDPPWPVDFARDLTDVDPGRGSPTGLLANQRYVVMPIDEIAAMPIGDVLAADAWVFLWTTKKYLPIAIDLLSGWHCTYRFPMVWHKAVGPQMPGTPKFNAEFIIVGSMGAPQFSETHGFRIANIWPSAGHSVKPEGFYDLLRRVTPGPRLDVFGRRRIAGFESWGDEAPEGPALPSHYQGVFA